MRPECVPPHLPRNEGEVICEGRPRDPDHALFTARLFQYLYFAFRFNLHNISAFLRFFVHSVRMRFRLVLGWDGLGPGI